jgi:hypothetical protein
VKIQRIRNGRELRAKLKALPMVCRSGFVKMEALKANTQQLQVLKNQRLQSARGMR